MKGWYAEQKVFTVDDILALGAAREMVARCPPKVDGEWVRCHELCRAFIGAIETIMPSARPDYHLCDGKHLQIDHSWIVLVRSGAVLDLYTPGQLPQVRIVDRTLSRRPDHYNERSGVGAPYRVDVVYKLIDCMVTGA